MQTIKEKMIPAFRDANGGLFQAVEKADVGSAYQDLEKQGVALMGWADPFMPDRSLPEPVAAAWLDAVRAEVIAEGHIHYPEQAVKALEAGAFALVVGGAITRPAEITARFTGAINAAKK